jgi:hypothetical protein
MEKMYRLKPEARPFFKEKFATAVMPLESWTLTYQADMNAIEEVKAPHITYGHRTKSGGTLAGWSAEDGSHFHFTINFPSTKYQEHDKFSNGKVLAALMDKIQSAIDWHFQDFLEAENDSQTTNQ